MLEWRARAGRGVTLTRKLKLFRVHLLFRVAKGLRAG